MKVGMVDPIALLRLPPNHPNLDLDHEICEFTKRNAGTFGNSMPETYQQTGACWYKPQKWWFGMVYYWIWHPKKDGIGQDWSSKHGSGRDQPHKFRWMIFSRAMQLAWKPEMWESTQSLLWTNTARNTTGDLKPFKCVFSVAFCQWRCTCCSSPEDQSFLSWLNPQSLPAPQGDIWTPSALRSFWGCLKH